MRPALLKSLQNLGVEYLDLWLMHYPCAMDPDTEDIKVIDVDYRDTWREMEKAVDDGLVRNIGVSSESANPPRTNNADFSKVELENLLDTCRIKPAVHQLERHPYLPQNAFMAWHKKIGMHVTAYSPLGNTNPSFAESDTLPPIQKNAAVVALAAKYGISPANVLVSLQLSEGCSVLPKSVTKSRIEENRNVVLLSQKDIAQIYDSVKGMRRRYCDFSEIIGYKYYADLDDQD